MPYFFWRLVPPSQRFEDIGARAKTAVDENGDLAADARHDLRQALERATSAGILVSAVVGHNDAVRSVPDRELGILACNDALEDQLHACHAPDAFDIVPRDKIGGLSPETAECAKHVVQGVGEGNAAFVLVATVAARIVFALEIRDPGALQILI